MNALLARSRVAMNRRVSFAAPSRPAALLFAVAAFLFFFQLGARDLVSSHEARAAQNAQRMLDTGEWGLPTLFDGQRDLQKPPGFYWLVAAGGRLNGGHVSPWIARLPAAASGLVAVLLVYAFLRREGYATGAFVAGAALASANHFVAIGRTARIDVPLTCAVAMALVSFYRGCLSGGRLSPTVGGDGTQTTEREPLGPPVDATADCRRQSATRWFLLSALAAACAVLLKGPVGLALIGTTAVAFLLVERLTVVPTSRPVLPPRSAVLGVVIVAAVAGPWFVWANSATDGEFVRVFFWYHNVARFTGESEALASHAWWFYGPRFALAFLPWTLLAPLAVWAVRSGMWRESRMFRFGVVWTVAMVVVLSASRFKRADYLLPALPGAALALGCAADRWLASRTNPRSAKLAKWAFGALLASGLAVWPVMWFVVEPVEAAKQEKRPFAAAIREHAPGRTVLLFRAESHLLAYHLGPPVHTLVEWSELRDTLTADGPHVVVMPPEYVADAIRITGRKLVPVATLADFTRLPPPRPLVCLRTAD